MTDPNVPAKAPPKRRTREELLREFVEGLPNGSGFYEFPKPGKTLTQQLDEIA